MLIVGGEFIHANFDGDIVGECMYVKWRWYKILLKVRKTQEGGVGGWIVFAFSSFSPTEVTVQKQIDFSFWSDNQNLNAVDKNREEREERHKAIIQVPSTNRK